MPKATRIATFVLLVAAIGRPVAAGPDDPPGQTSSPSAPIPIFLNTPADLDAFWKSLTRPDLVVIEGELYRKLLLAASPAAAPSTDHPAFVQSVAVSGQVAGEWARLVVEVRAAMATDGPAWVPIHLDGLTITDVRDASGDLPTRVAEGKGWQVELKGTGEHAFRVGLLAPVRSTVEGRRIELAVPPAASTRVDLFVPRNVVDASFGPDEPGGLATTPEGPGVKVSARLSPRSRIELAWRERSDPAVSLPTLLSAQGGIALEVERGSIRSKSSWVVESIRGTTGQVTLRLDPAEVLLGVEVDGKPVQVEARREAGRPIVTIPLAEPLRPNATRTLLLDTRRPISPNGTARVTFQGYPFDQARLQTGEVAISRTGPIFINPTPGRGLRRIDPRTELNESLRSRPETTLAFEFNDQPFDLNLAVEPAPARLRVEAKTTITLDPRSARLQSRLECRTSQGRVYEVKVVLPGGLELESAEPSDLVESYLVVPLDSEAPATPGVEAARLATIILKPKAWESDSFALTLKGWCPIDPSKPVALPIFRPKVESAEGERIVIITDRNVSAELARPTEPNEPAAAFRVDWGAAPGDWAWPSRRPGPESGVLRLRTDSDPETIPLNVSVRPRSIRHESTTNATIDRRGAEVVEDIAAEVAFGVVSKLDIALPPEVSGSWEVEGVELAGREPMGTEAGGYRRYRLRFARDYADAFRLRIRHRQDFAGPPTGAGEAKLRVEPIRVLEGSSTGRRLQVFAEAGDAISPDARGWEASAIPDASPPIEGGPPLRLSLRNVEERPGPVDLLVRAGPRVALPEVVVSRLWIRTIRRPEGDLATSARFWVEARDGSIRFALPPGSRWVGARVGHAALPEGNLEIASGEEYRLRLPNPHSSSPVLVAIDFVVPVAATAGGWPAVRLLGGGVVQQTIWEVLVASTKAGIGTPPGWTDENDWFWAGGLWRRRPAKGPLELAHWLTGGNARYRPGELIDPAGPAGYQSYLFSRVGPPTTLRFPIVGRIGLLLLCSGPILAVGLLVLARRPPPRMVAASTLILAFAAGTWVEPEVLILVAQSSLLGVALWLTALAMNWAIDRTGQPRSPRAGALIVGPATIGSSPAVRPPSPGSDDSTAIRPRPGGASSASTADHVVLLRATGLGHGDANLPDPAQP